MKKQIAVYLSALLFLTGVVYAEEASPNKPQRPDTDSGPRMRGRVVVEQVKRIFQRQEEKEAVKEKEESLPEGIGPVSSRPLFTVVPQGEYERLPSFDKILPKIKR